MSQTMYAPSFPGLSPRAFVLAAGRPLPYPLTAPHQKSYFRARNALYHLFRALGIGPGDFVVAPDYHHGNETAAVRATGADLRFYPIDRRLAPDLDAVRGLCAAGAKALLVIHYLGWPQPIAELRAIAREHGVTLVEDCALAMLSDVDEAPLGSFGDYSVFCLYKTLPVPNGAVLVANTSTGPPLPAATKSPGWPSVAGRTAERLNDWLRLRNDRVGRPAAALKRLAGDVLTRAGVARWPTGDSGFELDGVDLAMSPLTEHLLPRFDYAAIRCRRRANFLGLRARLQGQVTPLFDELPPGTCPLFFPVLVADKQATVAALVARGVQAIPFWNQGDAAACRPGSDAAFLRRHVMELPVHQGLDAAALDFVAAEVARATGVFCGSN
ncbi:MAG: DegT/DnrJ/EryC1/StrS family aminotransferase [Myxococcales bacterium]|nr:DegT/DnrJ/EryC1/StrS family aminotransferase [Myxococcales bacterium]